MPGNVMSDVPPGADVSDPECPYPGLAPFAGRYARWFFGRERAVDELLRRVTDRLTGAGPLVVVGGSGAGKSSLLRAGLVPAIASGALPVAGSTGWPQLVLTPTDHPVRALARRVSDLSPMPSLLVPGIQRIIEETVADAGGFAAALRDLLAAYPAGAVDAETRVVNAETRVVDAETRVGGGGGDMRDVSEARTAGDEVREARDRRVLIVVDQFEETFTLCEDERERWAFIEALCVAAQGTGDGRPPPAVVVLGVRADFYDRCAEYPRLLDSLQDGQVVLGPLSIASRATRSCGRPRPPASSWRPGLPT
jgi:hypothetical protein